jgi:hypothetical protein
MFTKLKILFLVAVMCTLASCKSRVDKLIDSYENVLEKYEHKDKLTPQNVLELNQQLAKIGIGGNGPVIEEWSKATPEQQQRFEAIQHRFILLSEKITY